MSSVAGLKHHWPHGYRRGPPGCSRESIELSALLPVAQHADGKRYRVSRDYDNRDEDQGDHDAKASS